MTGIPETNRVSEFLVDAHWAVSVNASKGEPNSERGWPQHEVPPLASSTGRGLASVHTVRGRGVPSKLCQSTLNTLHVPDVDLRIALNHAVNTQLMHV